LPERVDLVADTVGDATWKHSLKSLKPGGTLVVSGMTTGDPRGTDLSRIFLRQISVVGSTMGTREELERLVRFCVNHGIRPVIQMILPLREARRGFEAMFDGGIRGKIVFTI
jgi:D-arabinose 1-dehydrogenase-like Zn-dependent alcohol dehydrogenase